MGKGTKLLFVGFSILAVTSGCGVNDYSQASGGRFSPSIDGSQANSNNDGQNNSGPGSDPGSGVVLHIPLAPSSVVATLNPDDSVELTITDQADNETSFEILRIRQGATDGTHTSMSHTGTGSFTFLDPDSLDLGTFTYKVRAINADGASSYKTSNSITISIHDQK